MKIEYKGVTSKDHSKAIVAFSQGNYKLACTIWQNILNNTPSDILALKGLAFSTFLEQHDREAQSYIEEALSYSANDAELYNLLALINLRNGKVENSIEILLNGLEIQKTPLLQKTLNKIRHLKNPDYAKNISIMPLVHITLPHANFSIKHFFNNMGINNLWLIGGIVILLLIFFYPALRNGVLALNIRNRNSVFPATKASIKGLKNIINSRANFRVILDEKVIIQKFEELKKAISDQNPNRARILVNTILASNASLAVKERVEILESFIVDATTDNIDYVPTYADISIAPAIYNGVMLRWQGMIANLHHQGRKLTTFDLLINFIGNGQVEGIAAVEIKGLKEFNNGDKVTVMGLFGGITSDNRVIIQAQRILPLS